MNILFCHDGPVNCDPRGRFSAIGFNDKLFPRYETIFGKVSIVTRVHPVGEENYVEADRLSVDRFPVVEYPNYLNLKGIFANKSESDRKLKEAVSQCDALIVRLPSFLGSKCVELARKLKKPYLIEMVGCPWDSLRNHGISGKLLAPYLYGVTKRQVKRASHVLYVTGAFLQNRYPTEGKQIGCSDVELQRAEEANLEKRLQRNTDPKKLTVGTLGKIDLKYKGHATVIQAMKQLKAEGVDVRYQIVGPGDQSYLRTEVARAGVSDRVELVGPMGHDQVFAWLDGLDVYIQPSLTEGMPRALIEAMSTGCPCIASNAGGMPELLEPAYIFEKGNARQLSDILLNGAQNGLFGQAERNAEFAKGFAPDVLAEKRETFYRDFYSFVQEQVK